MVKVSKMLQVESNRAFFPTKGVGLNVRACGFCSPEYKK